MEGIGMTLPGGYEVTEQTRFRLVIPTYPGGDEIVPDMIQIKGVRTLVEVQRAYIKARDAFDAGASQFSSGAVYDEAGQEVARVSYNGRLWPAGEWFPGQQPLAEAPK